jgi:DNA-binding Lrp family transcriptional regulator
VSGQLDLIVELETGSIDGLNRVRDLIAGHAIVEDLTTAIVLRRDIDRELS